MGPEVAASLMTQVKARSQHTDEKWQHTARARLERKITEQFESQGSPYYSTARLWDDGIIDPTQTRQYLARGLAIAQSTAPVDEDLRPVYRM